MLVELVTAWRRHGRHPCLRRELSSVLVGLVGLRGTEFLASSFCSSLPRPLNVALLSGIRFSNLSQRPMYQKSPPAVASEKCRNVSLPDFACQCVRFQCFGTSRRKAAWQWCKILCRQLVSREVRHHLGSFLRHRTR